MNGVWPWIGGMSLGVLLLALVWWGWQRVGLGALQLGMSLC
ncbi:hypothetical protein RHM65_12765 [Pseudomonas sp. CCI4.2]|nr:hypothetical protein [Pseudomonas sp. CCI4.2]MEB0091528.1 hypothetical protein [Pseudomonas sp. CCI4.2]WPX51741.1 hypothetical protein RHM65_12765 [Pseudomonas sp. CCI4.2]